MSAGEGRRRDVSDQLRQVAASKFPPMQRPTIHNKYGKIHWAALRNNQGPSVPMSSIPGVAVAIIRLNVWWFNGAGWCWQYQVEGWDKNKAAADVEFGGHFLLREGGSEFLSRPKKDVYQTAALMEEKLATCLKTLGCEMPAISYQYGERS